MYTTLHTSVLDWYHRHGRHDLPWRKSDDPYHIYISEIMLQQTQVKTVLERFYFPFLERFPTLSHIRDASIEEVLKAWEGLGYYTRARNLHTAAQQCAGTLPSNAHDLVQLRGIGRSSAHAIAAFAYREPLPILDANVKRILHRFFALEARNEKRLWEYAYTLLDTHHPFEYNQAMMDIGAMICTPKSPTCDVCPLRSHCAGRADPSRYPMARPRKSKPTRHHHILLARDGDRLALFQRQERLLGGLWGFIPIEEERGEYIGTITHHYTHFTLEARVYVCDEPLADGEYFTPEQIATLPLSRADHKILELYYDQCITPDASR